MMNSLAHPALPHVFGVYTESKPYLIVTQFHGVTQNSVHISYTFKIYLQLDKELKPLETIKLSNTVADALEYMHNKRTLHNDVKTNNIVLQETESDQLLPVVIAFGKACLIEEGKPLHLDKKQQTEYKRLYKHIAPEAIEGRQKESEASDVFSLRHVLTETISYTKDCLCFRNLVNMCTAKWEIIPSVAFVKYDLKMMASSSSLQHVKC